MAICATKSFLGLVIGVLLSTVGFTALSENVNAVVITCSTGAIGGAAARALAPQHNLILTGRDLEKLQKIQEELVSVNPSGQYEICVLDFSKEESILEFAEFLARKKTPLSGFVLIGPRPSFYGKSLLQKPDVWHKVIQETFIGPFASLEAASPYLVDKSRVVVISGISSIELPPSSGPACVIRSMTSVYTKALSHNDDCKKVSYNTISPGVILTDFHQKRIEKTAQENGYTYEEQMGLDVAEIPLRRHATPEELAKLIAFLVSEESNGINGVNLAYDGGWSRAL